MLLRAEAKQQLLLVVAWGLGLGFPVTGSRGTVKGAACPHSLCVFKDVFSPSFQITCTAGACFPESGRWQPSAACERRLFGWEPQACMRVPKTRALLKLRGGGRGISAILSRSSVRSSKAWDDDLSESSEEDRDDGNGDGSYDDNADALDVVSMSPRPEQDEHEDEEDDVSSDSVSSNSGSSSTSSTSSSSDSNVVSSSGNGGSEGGDVESGADSNEDLLSLSPRDKVTTYTSCDGDLRHVVQLLGSSHRIIVVTGAGMSASCGIPTFRGQGQLYDSVAKEFGLAYGHQVMDANVFKQDPRPFFKVAARLLPGHHTPSPTHLFIRKLEQAGRLLRLYTQNIDTLERKAGIEQVVYCHGSFATATCTRCSNTVEGAEIQADIRLGRVPTCRAGGRTGPAVIAPGTGPPTSEPSCPWPPQEAGSSSSVQATSCGASAPSSEEDAHEEEEEEWRRYSEKLERGCRAGQVCGGVLKPDIVMFNEQLPREFEDRLTQDIPQADLLLVMGTSLSVAPVAHIPMMLRHIPSVMINAEPVMAQGVWDVLVQGACDDAIRSMRRQGLEESILATSHHLSPAITVEGQGVASPEHERTPACTPSRPLVPTDPACRAFVSCRESFATSGVGGAQDRREDGWWTLSAGKTSLGADGGGREEQGGGGRTGGRKRARAPAESREVDMYKDTPRTAKRSKERGRVAGPAAGHSSRHKMSNSFARLPTMAALQS